ncbi:carboxylating nicotinate-nucleotide diphosphorylase [Intrasporangium calvum]|uniref:Nicotinate-nucleotide pyrophosphorylase [carboxylating] n=1 Tax=Intrasporangium calvum (strain ATCC 23552 / DSM 43043 / JCM 3097 / NBRC 12989 / NCIMB 10167 / NRRL B-3866 / 7 KIP) TaxID=710696 RepID=E6S9X0_INTC7|nr:carboxylating nicotinate-nucleotide diphosphorylase [Intrasporangium calvum]ADU47160.1 nicotinate-nucleotide pyrophosphorylase (carboxylating) [Intrasporangium calvum DSM 43043]AXG12411.1 carboxylating nicotinate-nucleotide diphosphorylase [Intrasporangium calvum]
MNDFPEAAARALVATALREDLGPEGLDVTTLATIPAGQVRVGRVVAREPGVTAGGPVIEIVLQAVAELFGTEVPRVEVVTPDGTRIEPGDVIARLEGSTRVILTAERTILNIMSRLTGVATHTRRWADALEGTSTRVLDTRKTTPGLRLLEKYAVRAGGGTNKRMGLYDVAMVKDNHKLAAGSVAAAYRLVRETFPQVRIEVEVETPAEAQESYDAGARFIMCDNMAVPVLRETVELLRAAGEPVEIEATGGLTLESVAECAATGVDFVSVGALTHSSPIVDLALDLDE